MNGVSVKNHVKKNSCWNVQVVQIGFMEIVLELMQMMKNQLNNSNAKDA